MIKVDEYDQIIHFTHCIPTHGTIKKDHITLTVTIHQGDNSCKVTDTLSLVPII